MSQNVIPFSPQTASLEAIRQDSERFPRLYVVNEATALRQIQGFILNAAALRGQSIPSETIAYMATQLREVLLQDPDGLGLRFLSLEEIKREIRAAALGSRGDFYGVNVSSLYQVLCAYAKGAGARAEAALAERNHRELLEAQDRGPLSVLFLRYAELVKNAVNAKK